jgi:hypothetical protein
MAACITHTHAHTHTHQAARLWLHEVDRVFRDRMVNEADMAKFDEFRAGITKKYFEDVAGGLAAVEAAPLLFTSFMQVCRELGEGGMAAGPCRPYPPTHWRCPTNTNTHTHTA